MNKLFKTIQIILVISLVCISLGGFYVLYNASQQTSMIAYESIDIQKILNSSVIVNALFSGGSGTVIKLTNENMYILTCHHVIDMVLIWQEEIPELKVKVGYIRTDKYGETIGKTYYTAEIVKYDEDNDMALLKVKLIDENLTEVSIAEIEPEKGDAVYSVGNPLGMIRTLSKGILANKEEGFYICDNTTTYGNSGGGLFNDKGELIGVPSNVTGYYFKTDENEEETFVPETSLGYSRNLKTIKEFLEGVIYE